MSQKWTNEKITQMLLIIIKRHYQGTPDFEYVGAQLGVTKDAARIKFNNMRREFSIPEGDGLATPPSSPTRKRKAKDVKVEMEKETEEEETGENVKRARSDRSAAARASDKMKEQFDFREFIAWDEDGEMEVKAE